MLTKSKEANDNYLAKIVRISELKKHPNADKLQIAIIDFQEVIVDLSVKEGDLMVFFPIESEINADFLKKNNQFRKPELNDNPEKAGFFEDKCRVKAVKLRGEKSYGVLFPVESLFYLMDEKEANNDFFSENINVCFDTIGEVLLVKKFFVPVLQNNLTNRKAGKKPKVSRIIDGQVHLHVETENFLRNSYKVGPEDLISITYKIHGTSFWVSNVMVKKKLNIFYKLLKKIGLKVEDKEYDFIYGSRKVVKNEAETSKKDHFYGYDLWNDIKEEIKDKIPAGYTIYGECAGFTKTGGAIQKDYDYGCKEGQYKIFVYRVTFTNKDGLVYNLSTLQIKEFCDKTGLTYVPLFFFGKATEIVDSTKYEKENEWRRDFIKELESKYTEKDCFICKNKVPEEGIVIRKE